MSRMRKKKNLIPRMERCAAWLIQNPAELRGVWREKLSLAPDAPLYLEIGCGKGGFACGMAAAFPDVTFIAMERVNDALVVGMERAARENLKNLFFVSDDAANLLDFFAPGEVDRIYINFPDPWPPKKQAKRRLTNERFLEAYKYILSEEGEIHFKTDNKNLFAYSLNTFAATDFKLSNITFDLHADDIFNVRTEYEEKFASQGLPIYRLEAKKRPGMVPALSVAEMKLALALMRPPKQSDSQADEGEEEPAEDSANAEARPNSAPEGNA